MTLLGLALALTLGAPPPLACPPGTEHQGDRPMAAFEEWCGALQLDGKLRREGPSIQYYDDGGVWVERSYREGRLDGPFVERYRGGKVARAGSYARDEKSGVWRVYFEDGTLAEESTFREGTRHGPFKAYWPGGKLRTEGQHCHGAQCGEWRSYDEGGRLLGTAQYGALRDAP